MKKLTILFGGFVDISANKGDGVHALELTRNLRGLGCKVIVVVHSSKRMVEPDFYNTGAYAGARTMLLRLALFCFSALRARVRVTFMSSQCDVLYMRDYLFCMLGLGPKMLFSKKMVWEVNGIASQERAQKPHPFNVFLLPVIRMLEALAMAGADRIVAVSKGVMDVLLKRGCPRSKIVLIENGVNTDMFSSNIEESDIESEKKRLGVFHLNVPVLCYVGAVRPWQGLDILIDAAPLISDELGEIKVLIVGGGEGLSDLKEAAKKRGLFAVFGFPGTVPYTGVPLLIGLSDVCLAPFVRGRAASPIKIYEYMASGKPVIASRIPGLEFIEEKKLGILVTPEDPVELAKAAVHLLKAPEKTKEMALRGQAYVRENCSWSAVARRVMNLCEEVRSTNFEVRKKTPTKPP